MDRFDQEIVNSCLQGNEKAWEAFVQSHARRVYALSRRFTRCRADAEDLTQEVFIRIYLTLRSYRAESSSLSGWLMHVARNLLIDRYRRARRRERICPMLELDPSLHDLRAHDPLQDFARDEAAVTVHEALQKVSPSTRPVIVLHDLEGLALEEVAALLKIPLGTVKSRMTRGRRELARIVRLHDDRLPGSSHRRSDEAREPAGDRRRIAPAAQRADQEISGGPPARWTPAS